MLINLGQILELLALFTAVIAAWFWFRASSQTVRRVSKSEELNTLDLNRIVTAINRSQILNRRAALATAISAMAIALKYAHGVIVG